MDYPIWVWLGFGVLVLTILVLDLVVFHRTSRTIPVSEALWTAGFYILVAFGFAGFVFYYDGNQKGIEFLTTYFIEYALSMDNIMVFVVIMEHFRVPAIYQMRVLLWGVIGAFLLRGLFIWAGLELVNAFDWVILVLGLFLAYTGVKTLRSQEVEDDLSNNWVVRNASRFIHVTPEYDGNNFFTRSDTKKLSATPLFLVLIVLSIVDILFAVDSIPASFAITRDSFIIYTSNIFAVLGLRALYFALSGLLDRFRYLKTGLALVLIFIGLKMIYNYPSSLPDIPTAWALIITACLIFGSIFLSLAVPKTSENSQA